MSNIKLLPHNQITFDYIIDFAKHNRRICIPQATGTGKTYLEARILEYWNDRKAIVFAPNNEILGDTDKLLAEHNIYNYITITYQTLNNMSKEEILNIDVDIILFDEAHRLLADEWYKKVQILIESNPYSLIFGLTATPIRSDGRDIRKEIFENCSTHYITLAEAIVRDIVEMPVYVSALYTFDEITNDLEQKIDSGKNSSKEKIELRNKLNAAKKNLELSMGVPSIIKKYISDYNGKYIVFCRDTDHLEESVPLVNSWFRDSGYKGDINNYKIGVKYNDSDEKLEAFRNCDKVGLHLLFAIEKLNEGIHIESVDGVILLRPTTSNIVYYQQIGRCITANSDKKPIVLDLVNNANGVKVILKDDIDECINTRKRGGYVECSTDFDTEKYFIIDYLYESVNVFKEIEDRILSTCNKWTKEEDEILINHYAIDGIGFCLKKLPYRTKDAIAVRANKLGISKNRVKWTNDEIHILKTYYKKNIKKCYELIPYREKRAIQMMAKRIGLASHRLWKDEEIAFLKENYCKYDLDKIAELLNRSNTAVKRKLTDMGLYATNIWTKEEKEIAKEKYPVIGTKCIEFLPNKSIAAIKIFASTNNIKMNDKNLRKSKYKYVHWHKTKSKWSVGFNVNNKRKYFGYYDNEDEAGKVALEKAKEYGKV